jgi:hypothetical protein
MVQAFLKTASKKFCISFFINVINNIKKFNMGISLFDSKLFEILTLKIKKNINTPKICEIGAQQLNFDNKSFQDKDAEYAKNFFEKLGYKYECIDIDGSLGAYPLDLNFDKVPMHFYNEFHLVTNAGTTEHIANQDNSFKMIHDLTKVGGYMYHNLPFQGNENHCLLNYNPKFFWMLARSNDYKWIYFNLFPSKEKHKIIKDILNNIKNDLGVEVEDNNKARLENLELIDVQVIVIFQKITDQKYVSPVDVLTGTRTKFKYLKDVYRNCFKD